MKPFQDFMIQEVMYTPWFPWVFGVCVLLAAFALMFLAGYLARAVYVRCQGVARGILPGPRTRMTFVVIALSAAEYAVVRFCFPAETLYHAFALVVTSFAFWAYVAYPVVRAIMVMIVIPAAQAVWKAYRHLDNLQVEAAEGQRALSDYVQELIAAHAVAVSSAPTLVVIEGGRSSPKKMRSADHRLEKTGT